MFALTLASLWNAAVVSLSPRLLVCLHSYGETCRKNCDLILFRDNGRAYHE
jgi:hypothetical protein